MKQNWTILISNRSILAGHSHGHSADHLELHAWWSWSSWSRYPWSRLVFFFCDLFTLFSRDLAKTTSDSPAAQRKPVGRYGKSTHNTTSRLLGCGFPHSVNSSLWCQLSPSPRLSSAASSEHADDEWCALSVPCSADEPLTDLSDLS